MRIPRIYLAEPLEPSVEITLNSEASNYLLKVLRMEEGRDLIAFNGDGAEYHSIISSSSKRKATIRILKTEIVSRESELYTHLAIGLSKGDRMDWVLQKATELGVSEISPLFTERTEVKLKGERLQKKMGHWHQVIVSSCEQCQRNILPKINNPIHLHDFLNKERPGLKLVLHHRSDKALKQHAPPQTATLLIGPEGGLSEVEINQAISQGLYAPLKLGPRVLRTETAPIAALTALQLEWGDLKE